MPHMGEMGLQQPSVSGFPALFDLWDQLGVLGGESHLQLCLVQKKSRFVYPKEEVMRVQHRHNGFVLQDASLLCFLSYHAVPWRFTTTTGHSGAEKVSCPFICIFRTQDW